MGSVQIADIGNIPALFEAESKVLQLSLKDTNLGRGMGGNQPYPPRKFAAALGIGLHNSVTLKIAKKQHS